MNTQVKTTGSHATAAQSRPLYIQLNWIQLKFWPLYFAGLLTLLSAFSVIYVKDWNRRLLSHLEWQQQTEQYISIQWGKLLLERSTLMAPSRIQNIAENRFGMVRPRERHLIVIK